MPPQSNAALALKTSTTAVSATDSGVVHSMNFNNLSSPSPGITAQLTASLQGHQYADQTLVAPQVSPISIRGVLRTSHVYADRSNILVAYQCRDAAGNHRVSTHGIEVTLTVTRMSNDESQSATCDLSGLHQSAKHYLGLCRLTALPADWFITDSAASVTVHLTLHGKLLDESHLSDLILHGQPQWFSNLSEHYTSATAFATMPVSPLFAGEAFPVTVYAHTGGFAVSTFWVWLTLDLSLVQYISYSQSPLYQTVTLDYGGAQSEVLRFKAVGLQGSTTDDMVTDRRLRLLTVNLGLRAGVEPGSLSGIISVYVRQFINPGSNPFLENAGGFVFDDRDNAEQSGRVIVRPVESRGLFAYASSATLYNLAVLTGQSQSYALTVVRTQDDDRLHHDVAVVTSAATCSAVSSDAFTLDNCIIKLTSSHTIGATGVTVQATYGQLSVGVPLQVEYPGSVGIELHDSVLNRLEDSLGSPVPDCDESPALYQWTTAAATVDGLDATPLIEFAVTDATVVRVFSRAHLWNKLQGLAAGTVQVLLAGRSSLADRRLSASSSCTGASTSVGSDPNDWSLVAGAYQASAALTIGLKLDGIVTSVGTIAAFIGDSVRGVQSEITGVPDVALAGEFRGLGVWSLAVQGDPPDQGEIVSFEYSADGHQSTRLETTYTFIPEGIKGGVFSPFVLHGSSPAACAASPPPPFASTLLQVSDTGIRVRRIFSRVVSSVEWVVQPDPFTPGSLPFVASVRMRHALDHEGATGRVHVRVEWEDGSKEDISNVRPNVGELNLTSLSLRNLALDGPGDASLNFWMAHVPIGAEAECSDILQTTWTICGRQLAIGADLVHVNMPDPISMDFSALQNRLAPPSDDATAPGIGIPSSTLLVVRVTYDDGASREMSADERVSYRIAESSCAQIDSPRTLKITNDATGCDSVSVTAVVFGFNYSLAIPIVRLDRLQIDFTAYPNTGTNQAIAVSELGLVECTSDSFHHAVARAHAFLSDSPSRAYVVTSYTAFRSSETSVNIEGIRLKAEAAGPTVILGEFAGSTTGSAALHVYASVRNAVSGIRLSTDLQSSRTLSLEPLASQATRVILTYDNGAVIDDLKQADWLSLPSVISFSSTVPDAVSIDSAGTLTQHSNWPSEITLSAALACKQNDARVGTLAIDSNIRPAPGDLDLGSLSGLQFQQIGSLLSIPVRVRTPSGQRLINFQVR